jgi:phytoene/squalene synthetase
MCLHAFIKESDYSSADYKQIVKSARALGAAFQKVNFLRDLSADCDNLGRSYFPGIDLEKLTDADKIRLVHDIDEDLRLARSIVPDLPKSSRGAVALALNLFAHLNRRIEKTPAAVLRTKRISVPTSTKIWLAIRAASGGV